MKEETKDLIQVKKDTVAAVPCGITFVDGRIIFKLGNKWSQFFLGICHYSNCVCMVTPRDYERPLMLTTNLISEFENYCERAYYCLHFGCHLNRFDKEVFTSEFGGCKEMTLGLPKDIGSKPLWWSNEPFLSKWKDFTLNPEGGVLKFDESKFEKEM